MYAKNAVVIAEKRRPAVLSLGSHVQWGEAMRLRIGVALLSLLTSGVAGGQSWYYTANKGCMDFGNGVSQCFTQGFIQQVSDARPRSYDDVRRAFQTGQQAGEGVGTLIGVLIGMWVQHHRAVGAESNDLREWLAAYQRAQNETLDSQLQMLEGDERLCDELSRLDPEHSAQWSLGASNSRELQAATTSFERRLQQVEAMELREKSPKALRQVIDDPQHGVKWRVDSQQKQAQQEYVVHEFLVARAGLYTTEKPTAVALPALGANDAHLTGPTIASVTVERTTSNAEVYLDGAFVGNTPAVLHPPSGDHLIRIEAGSIKWERTLTVTDGADLHLRPDVGISGPH